MITPKDNPLLLAQEAVLALEAKQAQQVELYDVRDLAMLTDCVVIATAQNTPHLKALFNAVRLRFKAEGLACYRKSGDQESGWIMADYLSLVIHLFLPFSREYYGLDILLRSAARPGPAR
ncbi:MAG: ribosome silencing factor [Lentisphaerae bacterium]|jgi:ribosome-associated protein|nr:ribosome silencing factor [Lentisphaerota bacterium]